MLHFKLLSDRVISQPTRARIRRPKVFGAGRPRPLVREHKLKLVRHLRDLRASRALSRAHYDVAEKLLFRFHNAASGLCFPSLKALAAAAGCAVSTAQLAVAALERLGVLSWVHRLKRERVDGVVRVLRSSNAYVFSLPACLADRGDAALGSPRAAARPVAPGPAVPACAPAVSPAVDLLSPLEAALARARARFGFGEGSQ